MAQVRNKTRLDKVVNWFKKEMPEKFYEFEKPPHPALMPYPWAYQYINKPIVRWVERQGVHFYNSVVNKTELGLYPKEWNPRVHGIYCHWRYYGTNTDTPIWDVKVKDLGKWFARRNYTPRAMLREFSRWGYKYNYDYFKGPVYTNPLDYIFLLIFHFMFANWLIRNVILGQKEYMHAAIYHW